MKLSCNYLSKLNKKKIKKQNEILNEELRKIEDKWFNDDDEKNNTEENDKLTKRKVHKMRN
ncbi:hypothetical protein PFTANZ_01653 [Plasmodium falciparum Tanzania (2000708)]|uniref:Uncharacterized protein n=1 Tax=Plasmodium falciparum Tanzania (2000708) TaxID=1036725 RepID=A0A024WBA8_PLAFA|nr:hypothetical protein PFTANZ_01653 [Plasmodium falciparum Tanzania (2000708)]